MTKLAKNVFEGTLAEVRRKSFSLYLVSLKNPPVSALLTMPQAGKDAAHDAKAKMDTPRNFEIPPTV